MSNTAPRPQNTGLQHEESAARYQELVSRGLHLDLTRGKPSPAQLDLSAPLLTIVGPDSYLSADGIDTRNYGGAEGLRELREIFSDLLGIPVPQLLAQGSSSLTLMHSTLSFAVLHGTAGRGDPWSRPDQKLKFLCPTPGYDRHFAVSEALGFELVPVPLGDNGPDLETVKRLVAEDPTIKGMWAVPTYANPTGAVYPEEVVRELVSMPTAALDFRLFWDNAYGLHHLTEETYPIVDVLGLAAAAGNPDRVFVFASTSKMTFAGAGVSFWAGSPANIEWFLGHSAAQQIGPDKINQLRHARFFRDADGVRAHMRRHREIMEPKFAIVDEVLRDRLGDSGLARWTRPKGGYFVSLDVLPGTAARVIQLAGEAGIAMTPSGAAFPYGRDPRDENIRIAPSFATEDEVRQAIDGLATCVQLAADEKASVGR